MRLALLSLALQGCAPFGRMCHDMYAPSLVLLDLEAEEWPPGLYEIELQHADEFAMCAVTLPTADGEPVSCTGNAALEFSPDGAGIERFVATEFTPPFFVVDVLRDGELVAEERLQPEYEVDEPNGKGCGERSRATVALTL